MKFKLFNKRKDDAEEIASQLWKPKPPRIKQKYVLVKEIEGNGKLIIERGQRVIDTKVVHEVVELADPLRDRRHNSRMPAVKTIVVLECIEYEETARY